MKIDRREFLGATAIGAAGVLAGGAAPAAEPAVVAPVSVDPTATVALGKGLKCCRIGAGTGMRGGGRQSNHTRMGQEKFSALVGHAYDQGVRMFDLADMYGTHAYLAKALKDKPRDSYQVGTKIWVRPGGIPEKERPLADVLVKRFLKELQTDYIDVLQIHCMSDAEWTTKQRPQMDAMAKLKEQGLIRAHGVSCHSLPALSAAAEDPWVDVIHARINHAGARMDDKPEKVVPVLKKAHANGKGIIGMKLIGEGSFDAGQRKKALDWVMNLGCVDVLIVGFEKTQHVDEFKTNVTEHLEARARRSPVTIG